MGGLPKILESTIERSGLPPHFQVSRLVTKESPKGVWLVLGPHHEDSHTRGS